MWKIIPLLHNGLTLQLTRNIFDALPNSLKNSNARPKVKTTKEGVGVRF